MTEAVADTPDLRSPEAPKSNLLSASGASIPILLQYWRIVVRWRWVIAAIVLASVIAGFVVTMLTTPLYTASATIEIARQEDKIVNVRGLEPETTPIDNEFYQTQYSLLRARSLAESVVRSQRLASDNSFFETFRVDPKARADQRETESARRTRIATDILMGNVEIVPTRGSRLVEIRFTSPDPALSQRIANAWVAQFIESTLARRFESTSYARRFLEQRLEQLRHRLEESERRAVAYAANQRIINITGPESSDPQAPRTERSLAADDLVALNTALTEATADRIRAESRLRSSGGTSTEALSNAAINSLRQRRAEAAADYSKLLVQFEPGYPAAKALASQIAELDKAISREESRVRASLTNAYREALEREQTLQNRVKSLEGNVLDLRRRSIQYNIFQRDVDTNRQLYDGLLQRYKEIGVAGGVGTNNISVVDEAALPRRPSSPRLMLNLLIAFGIGLGVAAALTLALEQIDEALVDPTDLNRATGLPLLGAIPRITDGSMLESIADRKSAVAEAFLSVQTNLQFSTDHGVPRSLAVTSTRPAEGKSTACFALAQSLARTRRKVILVDGDMRSPSVHAIAGVANTAGTSNFLAGEDAVQSMIVPLPDAGFSVLPAGPQPPNAAELLTGQRLSQLIARLAADFDHVIIDSPPVLGLADAPLICSRVEGTLYVIEARGPRSSMVRVSLSRLRAANVTIIGGLLTKFDAQRAHYGYGYDYGYGYGQAESKA